MSLDAWVDQLGEELSAARVPRRPGALVPALAAALVAVLVVAVLAWARPLDPETEVGAPAPPPSVAPARLLERVYMGVSCPRANDITCDRVGIHVELRRPANAVTAEVGGRRVALLDEEWSGGGPLPRRAFAGFLQPAGLLEPGPLRVEPDGPGGFWQGEHPVVAPVRFVVERPDGSTVETVKWVDLHTGWG